MPTPVRLDPSLNTVPKLFHAKVKQFGDRVAMREKVLGVWQEISWNEYLDNVRIAGAALLALGVSKGECVSIISENNPEWLYCDIAVQCLGGISVGIYPTCSSEEVAYIINHSESRIFFVEDEEQLDKYLESRAELTCVEKVIVYDMEGLRKFKDDMVMSFDEFMAMGREERQKDPYRFEEIWPSVRPEDTAIVVYTSGTTGPPKGAMLSHNNITCANRMLVEANPVDEGNEILSFLPLCHVAERNCTTFQGLTSGVIINFAENLETVPEDLREISPHSFFAVPRIWEKFYSSIIIRMKDSTWLENKVFDWAVKTGRMIYALKAEEKPIPSMLKFKYFWAHLLVFRNMKRMLGLDRAAYMISGGAPIAPEILEFFHAAGLPIREVYGQTESTGPTTIHQGKDIKLGTVGKPCPGVEVRIAEDGEILVRGENVFQGYLKAPDATAETIVDGWLHSGDVGRMDDEGNLVIMDRKKDIIITAGGKNVTPQYIENKLKFSPYINDAVVIGDRRKYLTALVMIDKENVTQYAQEERIPFTTYKSLCHNQEINDLIQAEIAKVNKTLAQVETIKKFRLIDIELTSDDAELTATMKLKRKYVNQRFETLIADMY
ncbi:long-chain acyl-CoA synthetase [Desulfatibacillum alkenivorans DSM 16219]|uniref:Long-chain acyl-CoA synthetase n=1 Tax=Desulfatibacillum alkenivorans DSM 16219 TaxID=1121393 RepID=A0A1M6I4K2_9BACT|nr:AMP-binding protein [Desulfatibacillum alkenivorans]SHJ29363.1 long-chain acyl-CoA synthetase [Desulfatibacillum alkenivorans DSM 16219]